MNTDREWDRLVDQLNALERIAELLDGTTALPIQERDGNQPRVHLAMAVRGVVQAWQAWQLKGGHHG